MRNKILKTNFNPVFNNFFIKKNFSHIENIFNINKVEEYNRLGYTILPKVYGESTINKLKQEVDDIIFKADLEELKCVFDTSELNSDKYYLESGEKVN